MSYEELLAGAKALEGSTLETSTGKPFRVGVYMDCPFFVPESTGQGRSDGRRATQRFLERFNETGSLKTSDYKGLTQSASYLIPLVLAIKGDA